jgi:hypothetical protein
MYEFFQSFRGAAVRPRTRNPAKLAVFVFLDSGFVAPISGLPEIGFDDAQVGQDRLACAAPE